MEKIIKLSEELKTAAVDSTSIEQKSDTIVSAPVNMMESTQIIESTSDITPIEEIRGTYIKLSRDGK